MTTLPATLLLLALIGAPASAAPPEAQEVPEQVPAWIVDEARFVVTVPPPGQDARVDATWTLRPMRAAWMELRLAGPAALVDEASVPLSAGRDGYSALLAPSGRLTTVRARLRVPTSGSSFDLPITPGTRNTVEVVAPGLDARVVGAVRRDATAWDGRLEQGLHVTWSAAAPRAPRAEAPVLVAERSIAAWAEEGALEVRARVRWRVLRGEVSSFTLDVSGLTDVVVTGPNVARVEGGGATRTVVTRAPVRGLLVLDVSARAALAAGRTVGIPGPTPRGAARTSSWQTLARSDEGELVPQESRPSVSPRDLPEWARGLSERPPVASWEGDAPVQVRFATLTAVQNPETVVERAVFTIANAREGRAFVRTVWHVRNERKQFLHVRPAPGFRALTARVSGIPVTPTSDGAGGLYVPMEKSIETVEGLLTFPVEVTWVAEGSAWERRGARELVVPAIDAPIQEVLWQVHLPRGYARDGKGGAVPAGPGRFLALGKGAAAPPPAEVVLDMEDDSAATAVQNAVQAYKSNSFDEAQQWLDQARSVGSKDANVDRLQSNLDVLADKRSGDDAQSRRVRELANAKTVLLEAEQERKMDEAEKAYERGDVEQAAAIAEEAADLARNIAVTEHKESRDASKKAEAASSFAKKAKQERRSSSGPPRDEPVAAATSNDDDLVADADLWLQENGGERVEVTDNAPADGIGGLIGGLGGLGARGTGLGGGGTAEGFAMRDSDEGEETLSLAAPEEPPAPPSPEPAAMATEAVVQKEFLAKIPVGRSYQTVTGPARAPARSAPERASAKPAAPPPPPPAVPDATRAPSAGAPRPVETRAALEVRAAPLTVALPLSGARVEDHAALLRTDAFPTLTVSYRQLKGDPR